MGSDCEEGERKEEEEEEEEEVEVAEAEEEETETSIEVFKVDVSSQVMVTSFTLPLGVLAVSLAAISSRD